MSKNMNSRKILLRLLGSFLILTSLPLGLYVYTRFGVLTAIVVFLIYGTSGFYLRLLAYEKTEREKYSSRELFMKSIMSNVIFLVGLILLIFLYNYLFK